MKLLGNTVLIEPMPDADLQTSASGLLLVNHYKKTNLKFRVLAVGPGAQRKRKHPRSGRERTVVAFDKPECAVGDCILTRAELDSDLVKHSFDDGTGRLIIYGHGVMLVWTQ
jgi:co-chaperonin GroES (HSP10)